MFKSSKSIFQEQSQPVRVEMTKSTQPIVRLMVSLALLAILFVCLYQVFHGLSLFNKGYGIADHILAVLLVISELFIALHSIGYFWSIFQSSRRPNKARTDIFTSFEAPPVVIYLATYNEPGEIIEDTLQSLVALDYPNLTIYLNCDSPKPAQAEIARALAEKFRVNFYHRVPNTGYKAGGINLFINRLGHDLPAAKYMVVLDADSRPVRTFVSELVSIAEKNQKLAFVQTPQFYANTAESLVAAGASSQQAVFYEYICDAKDVSGAMFCCGTNVLFRIEALLSVDGFDETSVTEDFATSLRLHKNGWESHYHNNVYVEGVGPETLAAYFTQQGRWALGTMGFFIQRIWPTLFKRKSLSLAQKWEYFLSGTYYFIGLTQIVLLSCPIAFLVFGLRPLIADPIVYLSAYLPAFVFSNTLFYLSMKSRRYRLKTVIIGQALNFITFAVFVGSTWSAIKGERKAFASTPKGQGGQLPWQVLWPQLFFLVASIIAVIFGLSRIIITGDLSITFNIFWAFYHIAILSTIFLFNRPVNLEKPQAMFDRFYVDGI